MRKSTHLRHLSLQYTEQVSNDFFKAHLDDLPSKSKNTVQIFVCVNSTKEYDFLYEIHLYNMCDARI